MNSKSVIGLVLLAVLAFGGLSSLFVVTEGEQALVVKFGEPRRTVTDAGLHMKIPFMEQVIFMEKRIMGLDVPPQEVTANDKRRLMVDNFARYRIIDPLKRYQAARTAERAESLLKVDMENTVKNVLAQQSVNDIVSGQRAELMQRIRDLTNEQAKSYGLEVVDVRLKRVDLPKENSDAIFERMKTERQREATEKRAVGQRDAVKIRALADRTAAELNADAGRKAQIIRGQADAEAVKIFAASFGQDEDFFEFYRTLQAYKKALNKDNTTLVLSPDSDFLKLFKNGDEKSGGKR